MYGAFRDINDYLYDPKCTYKVTINLQLCLLMLIEALELKGIKVISANTDGIVSLNLNKKLIIKLVVIGGKNITILNLNLLIMKNIFVMM